MLTEPRYVEVRGFRIGMDDGVSDSFVAAATDAIHALPEAVLSTLVAGGAYAWLTPTIIGKYPHYADYAVSGYGDGATWEAVSGQYLHKYRAAVMAETYKPRDQWISDVPHYPWPLYHELGHALDYTNGRPASSAEFRAAYLNDRRRARIRWPNECCDPEEIGYFMGPWRRGCIEAFAEACARLWVPPAQQNTLFCIAFADTVAWVADYLQGLAAPVSREVAA